MPTRASGLLLHVTSLPGSFGVGDLGPEAFRFVDYLAQAGQQLWQVLPLVPGGHGHSPYASPSTFAGNPLLISPECLVEDGLLTDEELADAPAFPADQVDFEAVAAYKEGLFQRAYHRFAKGASPMMATEFTSFAQEHARWLDDYALFAALKAHHGGAPWHEWSQPLARRTPEALRDARDRHAETIGRLRFEQFLFWRQWQSLRRYAHRYGIQIMGDLPIYVAHDSADVWTNPHLFHLDASGQASFVAGVPPDLFSETGQRWGNPIYRWEQMQANEFRWWRARLSHTLALVDLVRLDHFRGFEAYWSIPAEEETAVNGEWIEGPGAALFEALEAEVGSPLPIIAEDLGVITPQVRALMAQFRLPGMVVLEFGFGGPESEYLPHNYIPRVVAYTGTHDNDTFVGWLENIASAEEKTFARQYLALDHTREAPHEVALRVLMASVAETVVFPIQDVLGLGSEARMNTPGKETGNWGWRVRAEALTEDSAERLRHLVETYGRAPVSPVTDSREVESLE